MSSVGVVVPCYRYGHLLPQAVGSVLDQPGVDVRVLIIDDASPDDSADVAHRLAAEDPRVQVSVHPDNRGHIATYNEGLLHWCDSDYAVLLSADDLVTPGALTRAVAYLDANPGSGLVYGHYLRFDGTTALPRPRVGAPTWRTYEGAQWLRRRFRHGNGCIASPEVVVRTSVQRAVGGYDPALPHTGDIEMWMRFAAHADLGYLGGVDQAFYRVHGANMSAPYLDDTGIADLRQRWAAYAAFLAKEGDRLPDRAEQEAVIRATLAADALWRACRAIDHRGAAAGPAVAELVDFATSTYDAADRLPQHRALERRRRWADRIPAPVRPWAARAVPGAWAHRARQEWWWRRWQRTGV